MTSLTPNRDAVQRLAKDTRAALEAKCPDKTARDYVIGDLSIKLQDAVLEYLAETVDVRGDLADALANVSLAWANVVVCVAQNFAEQAAVDARQVATLLLNGSTIRVVQTLHATPDIRTEVPVQQPGSA